MRVDLLGHNGRKGKHWSLTRLQLKGKDVSMRPSCLVLHEMVPKPGINKPVLAASDVMK